MFKRSTPALNLLAALALSLVASGAWAQPKPEEPAAPPHVEPPKPEAPPAARAEGPLTPAHEQRTTPEPAAPHTVREQLVARNSKGELVIRDDLAGFGRARQWAFSSDAALTIQEQTSTHLENSRITTITLAPAADWFVLKNLSLGGVVGVTYQKATGIKGARITLGPRVGYNFEISRLLSLWPKLGFSYAHTTNSKQSLTAVPGGTSTFSNRTSANAVALSIFIPLMVHPAPHFFAGFGPFMDSDLSGYNRATVLGVKLTLGGWIDRDNGVSESGE